MRRNGFQLLSKFKVKQGVFILFLAFSFLFNVVSVEAAPTRPILQETDWRTGELQICWIGADTAATGHVMRLWVATHESDGQYEMKETWPIYEGDQEGCKVVQFLENGQSVWYYVDILDVLTGEKSTQSNALKQTPPITAFIINWPDMLKDLADALKAANDDMKDYIDDLLTPSDQAMQDLQDALDGLKDAVGAGAANNAGNQLQNGLDGVQSGMQPPIGVDDGNGTFTGGSTGSNLPYPNQNVPVPGGNGSPGNLEVPNPDSGTANELTIRIPYMVNMQGELIYMQLFTDEQMEKMKWLNLIRTLAGAIIFIMFGMWLVSRFSPQLKS